MVNLVSSPSNHQHHHIDFWLKRKKKKKPLTYTLKHFKIYLCHQNVASHMYLAPFLKPHKLTL
jgi:hypothetical protein